MSQPAEVEPGVAPDVAPQPGRVVARNAFHLVLGQAATTALAILLSATLGRTLGPADFGLYFLVISMSTFAYVFVEWGQLLFVVREVAREPGRAGDLLGSSLALRAAFAAAVAGPAGLVAWMFGYDARVCWYTVLFVAVTLPLSLAQGFGMVFRGRDRMGLDASVSVVNKAVVLALTLGLLSLGAGIPGVMVAQGLAGLVALVLAARLYRRLGAGPLRASGPTMREVLAGGTPILFMLFAISVQPYLDVIVLSKLAPARTVGWYGAAKNVMGTLVAPAVILASASYPRLSRAASDPAAFRRELRGAIRPLLWLGALGGVGTFLFAEVAIGLIYGLEGYGPATTVLQVFGLGLFLLFVDVLLGHVVTAAGRAKEFAIAKVASVAVATLLNLWLVPWFETHWGNGGVGVVVAFVLSEAIVFAGSLYLLPRGSLEPALALDVLRAIGAAGLTAALFQVLPPLSPLLAIPLCVAVYGVASLAVGLLSSSDLELARTLVRRRAKA